MLYMKRQQNIMKSKGTLEVKLLPLSFVVMIGDSFLNHSEPLFPSLGVGWTRWTLEFRKYLG